MNKFNKGMPFHGSAAVSGGKLTGTTDTDYFYFLCPKWGETQILQILDYVVTEDGPVEKYKGDETTCGTTAKTHGNR